VELLSALDQTMTIVSQREDWNVGYQQGADKETPPDPLMALPIPTQEMIIRSLGCAEDLAHEQACCYPVANR
jgi:hypothetical protein